MNMKIKKKNVDLVIDIIASSQRAMPAHFSSLNGKTKSFALTGYEIPQEHEYELATYAYSETPNSNEDKLTREQTFTTIKLGEDTVLAGYISKRLNDGRNKSDLIKSVITYNENLMEEHGSDITNLCEYGSVKKYLAECFDFGLQTASQVE